MKWIVLALFALLGPLILLVGNAPWWGWLIWLWLTLMLLDNTH